MRLFNWPWGDLQPRTYVIMCDFAWSFALFSGKGAGKSAQSHYSVMSRNSESPIGGQS
jgi:hypothetical protein